MRKSIFSQEIKKQYFVFTDSKKLKKKYQNFRNITFIHQDNLGWPNNTLLRYEMFEKNLSFFECYDYLYFLNANIVFKQNVGEEFIPDEKENGLLVVNHPGFYRGG